MYPNKASGAFGAQHHRTPTIFHSCDELLFIRVILLSLSSHLQGLLLYSELHLSFRRPQNISPVVFYELQTLVFVFNWQIKGFFSGISSKSSVGMEVASDGGFG